MQDIKTNLYELPPSKGRGFLHEITYQEGLFISYGDFIFFDALQKQHDSIPEKFIELIYLESGTLIRSQKGFKNETLKPGINVFVNNHKPICLHYAANKPIRFVIITLFASFYDTYIKQHFPDEFISLPDTLIHLCGEYHTAEMAFIFKQIENKMRQNFNNRVYYESKIGEIMSIMMNLGSKMDSSRLSLSRQDQVALQAVEKILSTEFIHRPTILELAKNAHMSPTKLKRSFKAYYHSTIGQYSLDARLKKALELLSHTELSVTEVGQTIGYQNTSKFSQVFLKQFGMYPKDYKRLFNIHTNT